MAGIASPPSSSARDRSRIARPHSTSRSSADTAIQVASARDGFADGASAPRRGCWCGRQGHRDPHTPIRAPSTTQPPSSSGRSPMRASYTAHAGQQHRRGDQERPEPAGDQHPQRDRSGDVRLEQRQSERHAGRQPIAVDDEGRDARERHRKQAELQQRARRGPAEAEQHGHDKRERAAIAADAQRRTSHGSDGASARPRTPSRAARAIAAARAPAATA